MKKLLLTPVFMLISCYLFSQTVKNPFEKTGYKVLMATSSKGEFAEFHDQEDIVEIGSVLYNTRTKEIVKILDKDSTTIDVSAATVAMSIDPLCEQYYWISPYVYCANNPIKFVDPTGMFYDDYYNYSGDFVYKDNKTTDNIKIVDQGTWGIMETQLGSKLTDGGTHKEVDQKLAANSKGIGDVKLDAKAYSKIFTDVLSKMDDVNMSKLYNGEVSIKAYNDSETAYTPYNNPSKTIANASAGEVDGKSRITASITSHTKSLFSTVSNVQNLLGAHEFIGHQVKGWGSATNTHHKVYDFQMQHSTWGNTTPSFKNEMKGKLQYYRKKELPSK